MYAAEMSPGLELSQAEAVHFAFITDDALRVRLVNVRTCGGCDQDIEASRLALFPKATRCTRCASIRRR